MDGRDISRDSAAVGVRSRKWESEKESIDEELVDQRQDTADCGKGWIQEWTAVADGLGNEFKDKAKRPLCHVIRKKKKNRDKKI